MSEIQFIIDRLNDAPFNKNLRLVEFDEKSPLQLIQTLQEVLEEIDDRQKQDEDVRDEPQDIRGSRMLTFLRMLKFPVQGNEQEGLHRGLAIGEKQVLYPVLYWLLQRLPQLQKRAYLGRYLMPVDVPVEYTQDPTLLEVMENYKALQQEFKHTHKAVDQLRGNDLRPGELKTEIAQLEDEKRQLQDKIEKLKRNTSDEPGFEEMLEVTSRLRAVQEEEGRLAEKVHEQRILLNQAEARLEDTTRRLQRLRQSSNNSQSAQAVLGQLAGDVQELAMKAEQELPLQLAEQHRKLQQLEKERAEPRRSRDDVEEMEMLARQLERDNTSLREQVDKVLASRGDSNLTMFRSQASMAAKKLEEKEAALEKAQEAAERLQQEIEMREGKLASLAGGGDAAAAGVLTREEFKAYGAKLREKTQLYKRMKQELAQLRSETVVLHRTEQILKSRDDKLEDFLDQLETDKGVEGYRRVHAELVQRSEQTAAVDSMKGSTLQEISELVNAITRELQGKKDRLRPLIEQLKATREEHQELEALYMKKKGGYEKVAVGLEVERQQSEQECDALQEECLSAESRFHYISNLDSIMEARLKRVEQEERWEQGDGRLLPDFKCYKDLYEHKLRQQESLSKQLRRQQKSIKEAEGGSSEQRKMFHDLQLLLRCKVRVQKSVLAESKADGLGGNDEAYLKTMDYAGGAGGTNVMTL